VLVAAGTSVSAGTRVLAGSVDVAAAIVGLPGVSEGSTSGVVGLDRLQADKARAMIRKMGKKILFDIKDSFLWIDCRIILPKFHVLHVPNLITPSGIDI
jgi:hypothetical protein